MEDYYNNGIKLSLRISSYKKVKEMKLWVIKEYMQKSHGWKTTAEARGSTLIRLLRVPDATVCECPGDFDVLSGRWLFRVFESTCMNGKRWS